MKIRIKIQSFLILGSFLLISVGIFNSPLAFSEEAAEISSGKFFKLEGEIMEVEELREPRGAAIYTVKDLTSGKTIRLFADPYRSLIQMGDEVKSAGDILGGSKATFIYRKTPDHDQPEVIFAKVTSSYYA